MASSLLVVITAAGLRVSLFGLRLVRVKMLPFDNKSEFQVIIDTSRGNNARGDGRVRPTRSAAYLRTVPEVTKLPDLRRHRLTHSISMD
jgi:multidrug efflux pump subunit AcrB